MSDLVARASWASTTTWATALAEGLCAGRYTGGMRLVRCLLIGIFVSAGEWASAEPEGVDPAAAAPAAAPAEIGPVDGPAEPVVALPRPVMTDSPPPPSLDQPPPSRALVDARAELQRRYREPLFRARSAAGANQAAEMFVEAGANEPDRALKWLLFAEARRLGAASGNAAVIHRSIVLASATYEFDALEMEFRSLDEIPLRGLSPQRASGVAEAAEAVASRAAIDGRRELALESQDLAIRAWQRAGAKEACRRAMVRHGEIAAD